MVALVSLKSCKTNNTNAKAMIINLLLLYSYCSFLYLCHGFSYLCCTLRILLNLSRSLKFPLPPKSKSSSEDLHKSLNWPLSVSEAVYPFPFCFPTVLRLQSPAELSESPLCYEVTIWEDFIELWCHLFNQLQPKIISQQ